MTTDVKTLTDFLLERIAEDEAGAQREQIVIPGGMRDEKGEWPTVPGERRPGSARALAECEAKRRIVAFFQQWEDVGPETPLVHGVLVAEGVVLPALALPYAAHPDYRPEWA
jgi:hypothetical protein